MYIKKYKSIQVLIGKNAVKIPASLPRPADRICVRFATCMQI